MCRYICTIGTSPETHLHSNKHFYSNPLSFGIYADFEDDNEIDNSIRNKTSKLYKQNPVLNGLYIISELEDFLKSEQYKSPLG